MQENKFPIKSISTSQWIEPQEKKATRRPSYTENHCSAEKKQNGKQSKNITVERVYQRSGSGWMIDKNIIEMIYCVTGCFKKIQKLTNFCLRPI